MDANVLSLTANRAFQLVTFVQLVLQPRPSTSELQDLGVSLAGLSHACVGERITIKD